MIRAAARAWAGALRDRRFAIRLFLTLLAFGGALALLSRFLEVVEGRPGAVLADPVLARIPPRDVTWLTFGLIYAGILLGLARLLPEPRRLLAALQAYALMVLFRIAAMWATPLDPPPGILPLHDPFVRFFGPGTLLTKDLFFSGHTATLFLLAAAVPGRRGKAVFVLGAAAVGACVLWQHVHWTIDVLAAPFFAYASWRIALRLSPDAAGAPRYRP